MDTLPVEPLSNILLLLPYYKLQIMKCVAKKFDIMDNHFWKQKVLNDYHYEATENYQYFYSFFDAPFCEMNQFYNNQLFNITASLWSLKINNALKTTFQFKWPDDIIHYRIIDHKQDSIGYNNVDWSDWIYLAMFLYEDIGFKIFTIQNTCEKINSMATISNEGKFKCIGLSDDITHCSFDFSNCVVYMKNTEPVFVHKTNTEQIDMMYKLFFYHYGDILFQDKYNQQLDMWTFPDIEW